MEPGHSIVNKRNEEIGDKGCENLRKKHWPELKEINLSKEYINI